MSFYYIWKQEEFMLLKNGQLPKPAVGPTHIDVNNINKELKK